MSLSYVHYCTISKQLIDWYLAVGKVYGTLNQQKAILVSRTKPSVFHQWMTGKRAAPANALERMKLTAFDNVRCLPRCISNKHSCYRKFLMDCSDPKLIERHYAFKKQILNHANPSTQRKILKHLKRVHSYRF